MIYTVAALIALGTSAASIAALSAMWFGDLREGFRIVIHSFTTAEIPDPPMMPDEPKSSGSSQLLFLCVVALLTVLSFASTVYWLKRLFA